MLTAILGTPLPADECLGLKAVHEPRHAGGLLDQPRGNLERRKSVLSRSFENPQDVVLLPGDAVGLDDPCGSPPDGIGSPKQRNGSLRRRRIPGLLAPLALGGHV